MTKAGKFGEQSAVRVRAAGTTAEEAGADSGARARRHGVAAGNAARRCLGARRTGALWGPGVFDMKAGMAFFVFAMRALRDGYPGRAKGVPAGEFGRGSGQRRLASADGGAGEEKRGGAGAGAGGRARRQAEDGAQRRGRLCSDGARESGARGSGLHDGRERDSGTGAADRADRGLHALGARHYGEPRVDARRNANECRSGRMCRRGGHADRAIEGCGGAGPQVPGVEARGQALPGGSDGRVESSAAGKNARM